MASPEPCRVYYEPIELTKFEFKVWCVLEQGHEGLHRLITGEELPTPSGQVG